MAAGGTILVASNGGLTTLTLNRPDKLNSFNEAMHAELRTALEHCAADQGCRSILLTGAGRAFCAGQDLSDRAMSADEEPPDLGDTLDRLYNPLIQLVRTLEKPVVCAVNGVAAGAGANLALACDIVLAARSASFIQAFCRLGLIPDAGGTWLLPRLVGEARARGLALLGERITASQSEYEGQNPGHAGRDQSLGDPQTQHFQGFRTADPSPTRKFARTFAPRTSPMPGA
jgi:2-(1,2-epoxy-1,2-dihydrophenyl)acetyl-CoA isomerase